MLNILTLCSYHTGCKKRVSHTEGYNFEKTNAWYVLNFKLCTHICSTHIEDFVSSSCIFQNLRMKVKVQPLVVTPCWVPCLSSHCQSITLGQSLHRVMSGNVSSILRCFGMNMSYTKLPFACCVLHEYTVIPVFRMTVMWSVSMLCFGQIPVHALVVCMTYSLTWCAMK